MKRPHLDRLTGEHCNGPYREARVYESYNNGMSVYIICLRCDTELFVGCFNDMTAKREAENA